MRIVESALSGVLVLEPRVLEDARGHFFESYRRSTFAGLGIDVEFVQDNQSGSAQHVLRGLHYQIQNPQGKLVRVVEGEIFDVAVDLRRSSPSFSKWFGVRLSASNHRLAWVPPGFAHGFLVLSDRAEVLYKTTDYYVPEHERCLRWDDPAVGIAWPSGITPVLSAKDAAGKSLCDAQCFE